MAEIEFKFSMVKNAIKNCPPWLEKLLKLTSLKRLKMHLNCPPSLK